MTKETHVDLPGSKRERDRTAFRVRQVSPEEKVTVTIELSGPKLPGPDKFVGQTMTLDMLEEKYGARKEDSKKVSKSLKKYGLKVEEVFPATRSMRVSGTAEAMEAAFKPDWAIMRSPSQGEYRGRKGTIQIPKELKGIVSGVFGLDQRRMARSRSGAKVSASHGTALRPLTPADIEKRYKFPPGNGQGQSIAIAEFGGGYFAKDTIAYCKNSGRPRPTNIRTIVVGDERVYTWEDLLDLPNPDQRKQILEGSFEVMLDVEIIAGLCPKANISVYFAKDDQRGWLDLLDTVIHARPVPVALSISWGYAEDDPYWSGNAIKAINAKLNAASRLGITVCVASGDEGWRDGCYEDNCQLAHVDFPASSPYVLGVGGTMLEGSGASSKEVTWRQDPMDGGFGGGATGGGVSTKNRRPVWQNVQVASLNTGVIDGRVVPDVAALAGSPYYYMVFVGFPWPNGKTSASAPVWAALIARINDNLPIDKQQRFLTPLLYKELRTGQTVGQASFRDVTIGKYASYRPGEGHIGYKAGPGFDAVTGWGVPNGLKLLECLKKI